MYFKTYGNFVIARHHAFSFSKASAAPNSVLSPNARPMSCKPIGKPCPSVPHGMLIAGSPAMLTGTVKMSDMYVSVTSLTFLPISNAVVGEVGPKSKSQSLSAASKSAFIFVLTLDALR